MTLQADNVAKAVAASRWRETGSRSAIIGNQLEHTSGRRHDDRRGWSEAGVTGEDIARIGQTPVFPRDIMG